MSLFIDRCKQRDIDVFFNSDSERIRYTCIIYESFEDYYNVELDRVIRLYARLHNHNIENPDQMS